MDKHTVLQLVEIAFAVAALCYGIFEHKKRQNLEKVFKTIMQTYPGDIAKIEESCTWAWQHARGGAIDAAKLPDCPEKHSVLEHLTLGTGDAAAAARMCHILFNQVLGFQQAQFNTRNIIHGEKNSLALTKQELDSQAAIK